MRLASALISAVSVLTVLTVPAAVAIAEPAGEPARQTTIASPLRDRLRVEGRGSFVIVDKRGVPDALRGGASVGASLLTFGKHVVSADAVAVFGHSEKIGYSYRVGTNVELDRRLPAIGASIYGALGGFYFVSRAEEDRSGLLLRATVGFRVYTSKRVYIGFEPFALERVPDGPGVQTPVRSRWAWEMTFLSVGFR